MPLQTNELYNVNIAKAQKENKSMFFTIGLSQLQHDMANTDTVWNITVWDINILICNFFQSEVFYKKN